MPYIPTEPVESSNIEAIGYDRKTTTLRIIFQGNRAYDYPMVPEQEYRKFLEAESKGKFFNTRIKPMYAHRTPRPEELEPPPDVPCACGQGMIGQHECQGGVDAEPAQAVPPPFWAPVEGGERPDGSVPSTTTHFHGYAVPEEHDHEGGDESHVHDADGEPVSVPPPDSQLFDAVEGALAQGGWMPIGPHEHPQLTSEPED